MALILSIESSGKTGSVALHNQGETIATTEIYLERSHSKLLAVIIKQLLGLTGHQAAQLDAVAVSGGPGSYTGLRIGASMAKGICFSIDRPLVCVNTLQVMAAEVAAANRQEGLLCPMLDARRMEVYTAIFDQELNTVMPTTAMILDPESLANHLDKGPILFFGDGAQKFLDIANRDTIDLYGDLHPKAKYMGELAFRKYEAGDFEDTDSFEPNYFKPVHTTTPKGLIK